MTPQEAATELIDHAMDTMGLSIEAAGAAASIMLSRLAGIALAAGIMTERKLDVLLAEIRGAVLLHSSSGIGEVANDA